jgi:hypothetical protein
LWCCCDERSLQGGALSRLATVVCVLLVCLQPARAPPIYLAVSIRMASYGLVNSSDCTYDVGLTVASWHHNTDVVDSRLDRA